MIVRLEKKETTDGKISNFLYLHIPIPDSSPPINSFTTGPTSAKKSDNFLKSSIKWREYWT